MNANTLRNVPLIALLALAIAGCGGTSGGNGNTEQIAELLFSPTSGTVPSPNDLAFDGSMDGTVNATSVIPTGDTDPIDSIESVNSQDGFSTIASSTASFTVPVDPATVVPGDTVRMFEVTVDPATKAVTGLVGELAAGTEFVASLSSADRNSRTLAVTPLAPLNASPTNPAVDDIGYLIAVTNGVEEEGSGAISASEEYELVKSGSPLVDGGGNSLVAGFSDAEATTLEGVRLLTQSHLAITGPAGIATSDLIATWTFTTQSIGAVIDDVDTNLVGSATAGPIVNTMEPTPNGAATIWAGSLTNLPYYLAEPSGADPDAPLTEFWEAATAGPAGERNLTAANPRPRERSKVAVPILVTIPIGSPATPDCPCDVVIFQHGITTNRKSLLGIADGLAAAGFAGVAIDMPLHGITDTGDLLYAGAGNERTFDLDLVDNATNEPGPDGQIDPSGTHLINLTSLRTSRDNLRQAVVDLLELEAALPSIDAAVGDALDPSTVHFVGQSLGSMVGVPFLAQAGGSITRAVLAVPGGGIAKLLDGSPSFGPPIAAGLADNNLVKGLSGYEQFLGAAQTLVDSADPLNNAGGAIASGTGIVAFEVVGGNSFPPDQVIPNNVLTPFQQGIPADTVPSPTAGTDPLATVMGLTQIGSTNDPGGAGSIVRFTAGEHSSLVNPAPDLATTTEMQNIMGAFLNAGGYTITDSSVVDEP